MDRNTHTEYTFVNLNTMFGEKVWWNQNEEAACCSEQILEEVVHKTTTYLPSHCPGNVTKQSDGEAPVQAFWGMGSILSSLVHSNMEWKYLLEFQQ